jgi:malate dehydrogenase (oxaloacetate-decarboxylating)
MLDNVTKKNVKVITVTDGERILGLGDQGIGGMGIPIGKLSLYTACGGISPAYTLPMVLDVGTNNQRLIEDPLYMGWRHPRISGPDYDAFVEEFIVAVKKKWPKVLLQFEDFALKNAVPLLQKYRRRICCFNDDIQGTAVVALGTLLSACRMKKEKLRDQRVVFLGAGSAGCGIAEKIVMRMKQDGLTDEEARARVFMVDRFGLLTDKMPNLLSFQMALAQKAENVAAWSTGSEEISLLETVKNARPTILIGVSGQPGLFTEQVIRAMHSGCPAPVVLPLSNPNTRVEALPEDILRWTNGQAMVATGSPFPPVHMGGREFAIAQCNNSYIFPGIGLGVISAGATEVTDGMLMAASDALAEITNELQGPAGGLLPEIEQIEKVSRRIALKVGAAAQRDGVAELKGEAALAEAIDHNFWRPEYRVYKPAVPR